MSVRAAIERRLAPSIGRCYRCERPWKPPRTRYLGFRDGVHSYEQLKGDRWWGLVGVDAHTTYYSDESGCFPLCEGCWAVLSPEERWPFYAALIEKWRRQGTEASRETVAKILQAVDLGL